MESKGRISKETHTQKTDETNVDKLNLCFKNTTYICVKNFF